MRVITPFLRWISSMLLHGSLFLMIGCFSFVFLISDRQVIKDTLVTSNIYQDIVPTILNEAQKQTDKSETALPLRDPAIREVIRTAFSPQLLQRQSYNIIDATYAWLDGSKENIEFSADFTQSKNAAIQGVATYSADRVLSLPLCDQIPGAINVFDVTCQPPGLSSEFIKKQVESDLQSLEVLKDVVFTQDDLPKSQQGKTMQEQFSYAPLVYQVLKSSIVPSVALFLIAAAVYVWVRLPLLKGLKSLGRDLLSNGLMLILMTVVFGFIIPRYTSMFAVSGEGIAGLMNRVLESYIHKFDILVINVALQVAATGFALLLIVRISQSNRGYKELRARAGVASSVVTRSPSSKPTESSNIPIVTSEPRRAQKKTKKKTTKKRRFGGIE